MEAQRALGASRGKPFLQQSHRSLPCLRPQRTVACRGLDMCQLGHQAMRQVVRPGDIVVDATCGNGHDSVFLAQAVGPSGVLYALDIQPAAVEATRQHLESALPPENQPETQLHCACHSELLEILGPYHAGAVKVVALNLGYLPGGDKSITTETETTRLAVEAALQAVCEGGLVAVMTYMHKPEEYELVSSMFASLGRPWATTETKLTNSRRSPPCLCLAWSLMAFKAIKLFFCAILGMNPTTARMNLRQDS